MKHIERTLMLTLLLLLMLPMSSPAEGKPTKEGSRIIFSIRDHMGREINGILGINVYYPNGTFIKAVLTNKTGYANLTLNPGRYSIYVMKGNRTVGYRKINITGTEGIIVIKAWTGNLEATIVDQEGNPLQGYIVLLYDQVLQNLTGNLTILKNRIGVLVSTSRTDSNGTVIFRGLFNGTYRMIVMASRPVGDITVNLQGDKKLRFEVNVTNLRINIMTETGKPLKNASVHILDGSGQIVFRGFSNKDGHVNLYPLYLDNYTVSIVWMGSEVWSGIIDTHKDRYLTIKSPVYNLSISIFDPFGNPLPDAKVEIKKKITMRRYAGFSIGIESDSSGRASILLPSGLYELHIQSGIYSATLNFNLKDDTVLKVRCNIQTSIWTLIFAVSSPLIILSLLLERRKLKRPLEIRKYKNMLLKLESMYNSGLVEYKLYRKLKEEYETRLMELSGREIR